jgi:hypothetical protein
MKAKPIAVYSPENIREEVAEIAATQGGSASSFLMRLYYLYRRDPLAYERLYIESMGHIFARNSTTANHAGRES